MPQRRAVALRFEAGAAAARRVLPGLPVPAEAPGQPVRPRPYAHPLDWDEALHRRAPYLRRTARRSVRGRVVPGRCCTRARRRVAPTAAAPSACCAFRERRANRSRACLSGGSHGRLLDDEHRTRHRTPSPEGARVRHAIVEPSRRLDCERPTPSAFFVDLVNYAPHKVERRRAHARHAPRLLRRRFRGGVPSWPPDVDDWHVKVLTMKEPPRRRRSPTCSGPLQRAGRVHRVPRVAAHPLRPHASRHQGATTTFLPQARRRR